MTKRTTEIILLCFTLLLINNCSNIFEPQLSNKYFDHISGYLAMDWKPQSIPNFKTNNTYLTEVNPVWFSIESDGCTVRKYSPDHFNEIINIAENNNIKVVPLISNSRNGWHPEWVEMMLNDANKRYLHIENIYNAINNSAIAGIEIDYEMISSIYRDQFSLFIEELTAKLHAHNKIVEIAVHAKTSDPGNWYGTIAQDWRRIGQAVDTVKVMAYNYNHKNSDPGPIAPLEWVEDIIDNVITDIPREKIVIGIAGYGIEWNITDNIGKEIEYSEINKIIATNSIAVTHDPIVTGIYNSGNIPHFSYTNSGKDYIVWYEDKTSTAEKIRLIKSYDLKGYAVWVMGSEDPSIWSIKLY